MKVKFGIVLLDQLDRYIVDNKLPIRPYFDKGLLLSLCTGRDCIASENTFKDLPKSLINLVKSITTIANSEYEVNLGIKTFKEYPPDIFFISRTPSDEPVQFRTINDKYFNIEWLTANYDIVINHHNLEIWLKK